MKLSDVLNATRAELQAAMQRNDPNGCWTDELCKIEFPDWLPSNAEVRWDAFCQMLAEQETERFSEQHFVIARVKAAIAELKCEKWLAECKTLSDVHDHCDGNMIGGTEFLGQFFDSDKDDTSLHSICSKSDAIINWWIEAGCLDYVFEDVPILREAVKP